MAPSIASSSYRLPRRWRRISVTLRGRAARYWTAASYGLPSGLDLEDLDLGDAERRRDLVLHDLDLHPAADHHVALLDRLDRPDVDAHGGVELQRPATRSSFGIPEHDSDLLAQLVDEDDRGLG